ncbi:oligosaccharide flippase family protein [candidate division KSB1 bacterium]|nr:oligosaccharide flippase family protein [candidate division KSB1 bacterium]
MNGKIIKTDPQKTLFGKMTGGLNIHLREIVQKGSVALIMKVFSVILMYGFNVFIARLLGAEPAGIFILGTTILVIGSAFGRLGLDNSLVRFCASLAVQQQWTDLKSLYRKSVLLTLVMSGFIAVLLYLTADFLALHLFSKPQTAVVIKILSPALVPFSLATMHNNLLKGLKKIRSFVFISDQILPLSALFLMIALYPVAGFNGVVFGYAAATLIMLLTAWQLWRKFMPGLRGLTGRFSWSKIFKSCLPLYLADIAQMAVLWAPHIFLGAFAESQDVAVFTAANRTAKLMSFVLFAVNLIAAPKIATLFEKEGAGAVKKLIAQSARLVALFCLPIFLLLVIFPQTIMGIFGPEYVRGAGILVLLAIGYYINVAFGPVVIGLTMSGYEKITAQIITGCGILAVLLQLLLVTRFGITGAAIANTITVAVRNLLAARFVYKRLGN